MALLHTRLFLDVFCNLLMRGKPDITLGLDVINEVFKDDDARSVADDVRMRRQEKQRPFLVGFIEFVDIHL